MRSTVFPSVSRSAIALMVSACFAPIPVALAEEPAALRLGASTISEFPAARGLSLATEEIRLASSRSAPRRAFTVRALRDRGVTVAAIDTGVNVDHIDLAGRIASGGYSVISGGSELADANGHGTLISSIIIARRDPDSRGRDPRVLPIKVFDGPTTTEAYVNAGLAYSIGRASIVNLSISAIGPVAETGLRDSVAAGQLLVVAAGNRGNANPDWPARFASQSWSNHQIIAVGAVDSSNVIASFSNRAGDTRDVFLVAPGVGVIGASAHSTSGLAIGSGTSVAAPYISGVAALVKSYWPQLSARQIAEVLFTTATDLGAPGTDDVYGRGLFNVSAALAPVGTVSVPLASGRTVLLTSIGYNPGPIAGAAVRA
ncbi:MAG: S8 family peptidase, partial [Burkholderiales bacterium]